MKLKLFLASLLLFVSANVIQAQTKVGYTNIELILAYMPETSTMNQNLQTFQKELSDKLQEKQNYSQQKYQEYLSLKEAQKLTDADAKTREEELIKLDQELKQLASESDQKLSNKRSELMTPILEKFQTAIDDVAKEGGYKLILNQTTSTGVSTILYGPDEDDVTKKVMRKLNIKIPETE
jgi:outer membrane protein